MRKQIVQIIIFFIIAALIGCEKDDNHSGNETNISKNFEDESHKSGQNCMTCHVQGEKGKGWFTVAGTVYDSLQLVPNPNGLVKLFATQDSPGSLVSTLEVDARGNFYTTSPVDFTNGLYVTVLNSSGKMKSMISAVYNSSCNSCHDGISIDQIWVE